MIKGDEIMLFLNNKSVAFGTNHTLTVSSDTVDIASKDHGVWGGSEPGKLHYEISAEHLYTEEAYDDLYTAYVNRTPFEVIIGRAANYDVNGIVDTSTANWTPDTSTATYYSGKVLVTNMTLNAQTGENANFNVTL